MTDHKTGKNRSNPDLVVGRGMVLQPILYSLAVERALAKQVVEGRLFYATTVGGFADHRIPMTDYNRAQGLQVLEIVDRAVEGRFLAAAPDERACMVRLPPGVRSTRRADQRKARERLADLDALRAMR